MIRDAEGECVAAFARSLPHSFSVFQSEAEACRAGLLVAIHQGWFDVELECDSEVVVAALTSAAEDCSEVGHIIEDCKDYLLAFNSVLVRHINREANGVAYRLTHLASCSCIDNLWFDETLSIIEDVLFKDLCNCNRSPGPSSLLGTLQLMHN